jgi:hypothetical protein
MTDEQKSFISQIATAVKKYMGNYNIKVASPIIAQAIIESGWGKSSLAAKYHNYFGLKCGSAWKGKSVNLSTKEEYTAGTLTTIKDNFRVFDSLEEGVKGYFDFINTSRYANLKGVTDPETYVKNIKADGYATSSTYVNTIMNCINTYTLTSYDGQGADEKKKDNETVAKEVIAGKWGNGEARKAKLKAAGYDPSAVQAIVNTLLSGSTQTATAKEVKVGSTVTIKSGAVYGGLSGTRGKSVPASQCGSKKHTVSQIATHNGVQEALLKEIVSWVAVSSLTAV